MESFIYLTVCILISYLFIFRFWQLVKIGLTVVVTFAVCWAPFLYSVESAKQVLHRLFPFARGIFEVQTIALIDF